MNKRLFFCSVLVACGPVYGQAPVVIATGLRAPQKIVMTRQGNFLVSETSLDPNAGRISIVSRSGLRRSLIEGLPSGTTVVGDGSGPTAMVIAGRATLYVAIGGGDAERRGTQAGTSVYNPAGMSSRLFCSVLEFAFDSPLDVLAGTFTLTADQRNSIADGYSVQLSDGAGGMARASLLIKLPEAVPDPMTLYRFSNPWGLELSSSGRVLYLTDASSNSLIAIEPESGRRRTVVYFPQLRNAGTMGPPFIDPVPTSVRRYGRQVLVTFLTGFPFTPRYARVLAVNPGERTTEPFIYELTSATDILVRERASGTSQFFVLEFSQNQLANPPVPGRLLRYDNPVGTVVTNQLVTPVSMVLDEESASIFVLQLTGQIVQVRFQ